MAQWPTVPREQATATIIDGKIYVFGGIGKDKSGVITLQKMSIPMILLKINGKN
ncbi:hypothetical protein ACVV4A_22935 [Escherichia coli]